QSPLRHGRPSEACPWSHSNARHARTAIDRSVHPPPIKWCVSAPSWPSLLKFKTRSRLSCGLISRPSCTVVQIPSNVYFNDPELGPFPPLSCRLSSLKFVEGRPSLRENTRKRLLPWIL